MTIALTKSTVEKSGVKNEMDASALSPRNWAATTLSTRMLRVSAQTEIDAVKSIDLKRLPQKVFFIRIGY